MTSPGRPLSVRARGARRLSQMTVGLVAMSVAGVAALVGHEAGIGNASTSTTVTPTTTTNNSTTSGGGRTTNDDGTTSSSSALSSSQSPPQATSGGS